MPLSINLTEFSNSGNSRTYALDNHSAVEPHIVIQKRKVPGGNSQVAETSFDVIVATRDTEGRILKERQRISIIARSPMLGATADMDEVISRTRAIVASDEFSTAIQTQLYIK
jgi:hypothetical protein